LAASSIAPFLCKQLPECGGQMTTLLIIWLLIQIPGGIALGKLIKNGAIR